MLTQREVVREYCRIQSLVYKSIDGYRLPSDGFCDICPFHNNPDSFRHTGETIDFVRAAVVEKLLREGFKIAEGFDPVTGKELEQENASS